LDTAKGDYYMGTLSADVPSFGRHLKQQQEDIPAAQKKAHEDLEKAKASGDKKKIDAAEAAVKKADAAVPVRRVPLGPEMFDMVHPGDWIWYYNANPTGDHSLIFVEWIDKSDKDFTTETGEAGKYRTASLFSQLDNKKGGGNHHTSKIGYPYSEKNGVL